MKEFCMDSTCMYESISDSTLLTKKPSDGTIKKIQEEKTSTLKFLSELTSEWPEIVKIAEKIKSGEIDEKSKLWINELAEATGWDENAVADELVNICADPSDRVKKYKELHEEYLRDAKVFKEKGETRQAGEKLWGAITALIKLYAATKDFPIAHWSRGKIEKFITSNVEEKYKNIFRNLLDKAQVFHEHFYEAHLDNETFEERWKETTKLLEEARKIVYEKI